jgi:hypothetical protein
VRIATELIRLPIFAMLEEEIGICCRRALYASAELQQLQNMRD